MVRSKVDSPSNLTSGIVEGDCYNMHAHLLGNINREQMSPKLSLSEIIKQCNEKGYFAIVSFGSACCDVMLATRLPRLIASGLARQYRRLALLPLLTRGEDNSRTLITRLHQHRSRAVFRYSKPP